MNEAQTVVYTASLIFVFWMGFIAHIFNLDPDNGSPAILGWIIGLVIPTAGFIIALVFLIIKNL